MMLRRYPSNVTCDSLPVKKKGEQNRIPHPAMCINFPKPLIGGIVVCHSSYYPL